MADQTITPVQLVIDTFKESAGTVWATLTAANAGVVVAPKDGKYLLEFIDDTGGAVVTITGSTNADKSKEGLMGENGSLASNATAVLGGTGAVMTNNDSTSVPIITSIAIDSSRFKQMSGSDLGKLRITTTAAIYARCVVLP
jgi:hypothetical protein